MIDPRTTLLDLRGRYWSLKQAVLNSVDPCADRHDAVAELDTSFMHIVHALKKAEHSETETGEGS